MGDHRPGRARPGSVCGARVTCKKPFDLHLARLIIYHSAFSIRRPFRLARRADGRGPVRSWPTHIDTPQTLKQTKLGATRGPSENRAGAPSRSCTPPAARCPRQAMTSRHTSRRLTHLLVAPASFLLTNSPARRAQRTSESSAFEYRSPPASTHSTRTQCSLCSAHQRKVSRTADL